ncbi:MAG: peptidylprolyl isomerase [Cytophagales bacterium]|nr:MAG: peptidylprolyl isomerase [Cytophagales bacterium]TAF59495.1 MAG: peptidylprolyl isomerase [Cytophagales bacterium]
MIRFIVSTLCYFLFLSGIAQAQVESMVVDKIVAEIDNRIILKSEVENAYLGYLQENKLSPDPNLKCEILRQLILNKVMAAKAEIDSIVVPDASIDFEMERRMMAMVDRAGSQEALEQAIGKTLTEAKDDLRPLVIEQLTIGEVQREITQGVSVTPGKVKKFFNAFPKDSLPLFPTEYVLAELVKKPIVNKASKNKSRQALFDIKARILAGEDFATLASKNSEDLGSAAEGGNLGFRARGELVPEFEETVYKLKEGEISDPVESEFGFHLIQLIERRGNRFNSRHILLTPKPDKGDFDFTQKFLDSLRRDIQAGKYTFEEAVKAHSDDKSSRTQGGVKLNPQTGSNKLTIEDLDYTLFKTIDTMKINQVSSVIKSRTVDGKDAFKLILYKKKIEAHEASFERDYEKIYQATLENEKNDKINRWFENAIENLYIDIAPEYKKCDVLNF